MGGWPLKFFSGGGAGLQRLGDQNPGGSWSRSVRMKVPAALSLSSDASGEVSITLTQPQSLDLHLQHFLKMAQSSLHKAWADVSDTARA